VKLPRDITHTLRLRDTGPPLARFLSEAGGLGCKLGPLLVQLPPSLAFDRDVAAAFFTLLRTQFPGLVACEPRHPTWFGADGGALLARFRVAQVAADPACVPAAARPGGWPGLAYHRLHGSPETYRSAYEPERLAAVARQLMEARGVGAAAWCIFDNTALGAAAGQALEVSRQLGCA